MARNGAGVYSPINLVTNGDTSDATLFNATLNDVATALTSSIAVDGQSVVTANIPLAGYKLTGVGAATARTDAASLANIQDATGLWVAGGGTADAITATYSPAITAVVDGMLLAVRATAANTTTTPTFSPNGLTARTIVKQGGQALAVGDIRAVSHDLLLRYRATGTVWELLNPATGTMAIQAASAVAITGGTIAGLTTLGASAAAITGGSITGITDLAVADGGTGASTFTDGGVLIGNGTGAVQVTSAGTSGQVLTSNGAGVDPTFQAAAAAGYTLGTPQATTSGTSFNFGSIPAGTKQIIISFQGVSLSGTNGILVQIGDSGGIETTGYSATGTVAVSSAVSAGANSSAGFYVYAGTTGDVRSGHMILTLLNAATFLWSESHVMKRAGSDTHIGGGDKALSAELTQLTITRDGADTFDAGSINIMYI